MAVIATEPVTASQTAAFETPQVMAAFRQALQQANEQAGPATVGFRNGDADSAIETGYDITVVKFDGASPAA